MGSILNTMLRDRIPVYVTSSLEETAEVVLKVEGNWEQFVGGARQYGESLTIKKGAKMNPELCYRAQLATIPGMSMKMASAVASNYPTMAHLVDGLRAGESLADIKVDGRRLGPVRGRRLVEYLLGEGGSES